MRCPQKTKIKHEGIEIPKKEEFEKLKQKLHSAIFAPDQDKLERLLRLELSVIWMFEALSDIFTDYYISVKRGDISLSSKDIDMMARAASTISERVMNHITTTQLHEEEGIIPSDGFDKIECSEVIKRAEEDIRMLKEKAS